MDLLLSFFILIISTLIGIMIGLFLDIKSYLIISIIIICLYIILEYLNEYMICSKKITQNKINKLKQADALHTIAASAGSAASTTTTLANITDYHPSKNDSNGKFAKQIELEDTNYAIFKKKDESGNDKNSLPLDGLSPKDLISSLNYITYSTANPYKPISYNNYKMHADKYLDEDGTKLSTNDIKLQSFAKAHYPQLTEDQIDTGDSLNYGSGEYSCFQSAQLFSNVNKESIVVDTIASFPVPEVASL